MPRPYSEDLCWRAVWLNVVHGMNPARLAEVLFMAERSVYRYLALFNLTGCVDSKEHSSGPEEVISDLEQFIILQSLIHKSTLQLSEVQGKLLKLLVLGSINQQSAVQ